METVFVIERSLDRVARAFRLAAIALSDCEGDFDEVAYLDECAMTPEELRKARAQAWETVSALLEQMARVVSVMRAGGAGMIALRGEDLQEQCTAVINAIHKKQHEAWCLRHSPPWQQVRAEVADAAQR
jgi:hypothetical protein